MSSLDDAFPEMAAALIDRYGKPEAESAEPDGDDEFERMIAVLLSRAVGAKKSALVVDCLRNAELLTPKALAEVDLLELVGVIRESAISITANALRPVTRLAQWIDEHHQGKSSILGDDARAAGDLRDELASIRGIGFAGADALLLHGLRRPSYSVDRASLRILIRHDWADQTTTSDEARDLLTGHAATMAKHDEREQTRILASLSVGMRQVGRQYCRAAGPRCVGCPLESLLPDGGPLELES